MPKPTSTCRGAAGDFRQHHMRRERRCALEQLSPLVGGATAQHRLEQLARDPERPLALQLGPACAGHLESPLLGRARRRAEQARLPDSGSALDDHHPASARDCAIESNAEPIELAIALEQYGDRP